MKLSMMWQVDRTVDAAGNSPIAEVILQRWPHDEGSTRFFRSSANFLYTFRHQGYAYFLRFAASAERTREAVQAEIDVLHWLNGGGIRVATPMPSRTGHDVETVETELGTFHAAVFAALPGAQREIEELDQSEFRAWGAALGALHAALKAYPRAASAARGTWRDHLEMIGRYLPSDAPAVRQEHDELASLLDRLPVNRDTFGLIHFDFELDNLIWHDGGIGILDFDDCAHYWYVADVAFALRDLFAGGVELNGPLFQAFARGYALHCPVVDDDLLSQVPIFSRLIDLLTYARIVRARDLAINQDHPAWLVGLDGRLRERTEAYKASLERRGS